MRRIAPPSIELSPASTPSQLRPVNSLIFGLPVAIGSMPPRSSLTSSFSITDSNNEVICPLSNQDGSHCRKRCLGVSLRPPAPGCPTPRPLPHDQKYIFKRQK
ncbi:hypothetical protein LLEC1_07617 [Akanthomyces lecanii]|uniref:Uncharacterized protein n=1 Tax=Cordyceps confragosa TaxID=2714763 RepID=A0A179IKC5_CORDF|nr:hypothetical protein LLEC1_07617 [Akanthomyces lecanii]